MVSRSVAENRFITLEWLVLLVHQPDIAVEACRRGRRENCTR
jgi:hypothetical protein